jgi:cellulose synthase (UDP-forming)
MELLRETMVCALSMSYPHQTWVLDDEQREAVHKLAEELGYQYRTRKNNKHAKAGNLNHALKRTRGEFIVA